MLSVEKMLTNHANAANTPTNDIFFKFYCNYIANVVKCDTSNILYC